MPHNVRCCFEVRGFKNWGKGYLVVQKAQSPSPQSSVARSPLGVEAAEEILDRIMSVAHLAVTIDGYDPMG
jgi:hypothetical protein